MMRLLLALCLLISLSSGVFAQSNFSPRAPTGNLTLSSGGTAQLFQAGGNYVACVIVNPATASEQGIATAEAIWVDVVTTAAASAGSTHISIEAGSSLSIGPTQRAISWVAATAGHLIEGYCQ